MSSATAIPACWATVVLSLPSSMRHWPWMPGLLILTWMIVAFYRTGLRLMREGSSPRVRRLAAAVCAGVFTYTVHGLFNEYWRLPKIALTLWVFVGVLGALVRIDEAERADPPAGRLSSETPV